MSGPRYAPHASVREMEVDGEVTLFHPDSQAVLVLNSTASAIWRLVDGERTSADIAGVLCTRYQAEVKAVASGVDAALAELERHGVVEARR